MNNHAKAAAVKLAMAHGLINLTRDMIAQECGFPVNSFEHNVGATFATLVDVLKSEGHIGPVGHVSKGRTDRDLREQSIIEAAVRVAAKRGYQSMQRPDIAEEAGVSQALVSHYFGTLDNLRALVMDYAVRKEVVEVVAQGLGCSNDIARRASPELKKKALKYLADH